MPKIKVGDLVAIPYSGDLMQVVTVAEVSTTWAPDDTLTVKCSEGTYIVYASEVEVLFPED